VLFERVGNLTFVFSSGMSDEEKTLFTQALDDWQNRLNQSGVGFSISSGGGTVILVGVDPSLNTRYDYEVWGEADLNENKVNINGDSGHRDRSFRPS
jgi:hypothetical protein